MNTINLLEQLAAAVEQSGANLAPTYQEYMPLAFAIANSCGEQARDLFHRLCRPSDKYRYDEADKLYTHALQKGTGANTLGTVFHLAELAGVKMEKNLAILQGGRPPLTHTQARTYEGTTAHGEPNTRYNSSSEQNTRYSNTQYTDGNGNKQNARCNSSEQNTVQNLPNAVKSQSLSPCAEDLPRFPSYRWPEFLQRITDCGDSPAQRDILLLGTLTVIGSTLNRLVSIMYGRKRKYPCLQTFIIAPPASGKGALTWVRRLAEPLHDDMMKTYNEKLKEYRSEKVHWDTLGKQRASTPEPEQPRMKMFLIAGDNSGTGILENLIDADGVGLVCETEADTVSAAIGSDYGHWSDTLRKSYDHERLAFNRRTNHEYRECEKSFLSVLLSGTPAQVKPLIPTAENGLFSRQLFYCMPAIDEWQDQFSLSDTDYDTRFTAWGRQWKELLDALTGSASNIRLKLTDEQKNEFNTHFARVFGRAGAVHGDSMRSTVARIAVNVCRMLCITALLRSLESLLCKEGAAQKHGTVPHPYADMVHTLLRCPGLSPADGIPTENLKDGIVSLWDLTVRNDDFHAVLSLIEPLYLHSCHVLSLLPANAAPLAPAEQPESLFDRLPLRFTRNRALEEAERRGISAVALDSMLSRLTSRGILVRSARGEYKFATRISTRVCVCEKAAPAARLQDSASDEARQEESK